MSDFFFIAGGGSCDNVVCRKSGIVDGVVYRGLRGKFLRFTRMVAAAIIVMTLVLVSYTQPIRCVLGSSLGIPGVIAKGRRGRGQEK